MDKKPNSPSLKKNVIFNIIYQLVQIGVPILLIPILSGRLKTDGNGNYAFIHSIVLYFSYFALLGVNLYGTRTIAKAKAKRFTNAKKTFWTIFFAKSFTSLIAILGYLIFAIIYHQNAFVVYTQFLFLVGNLLDVSWFFSGDENFKSLCIRNVLVKTLSLVLIILFVKNENDVGIYSLILGLAEVLNQVFMWGLLLKKKVFAKKNLKGIKKKDIIEALKGMVIFFIPQLLIELYTILNTTILGAVHGATGSFSEVGIYDYANKIVSVLTTITVSLGIVFLARLSSLNEENKSDEIKEKIKQSLYYSLYISLPLVVGVIGTGHSFIQWFLNGDDWSKVGVLLYFLPIKVLFVAISNTLGVQYLISTGKMKKYIFSVGIGALVCITLNIILVKSLGAIGSAIAVVVAEACVTLVQILLVRKEIDVLSVLKSFWKPVLGALAMGAFLALVYFCFYDSIVMFFAAKVSGKLSLIFADILIIVCAALIYFSVLILLKEKTISKYFLEKFKIKPKKDKYLVVGVFICIVTLVLSVGFYRPYNLRYEHSFSIERRAASASFNSINNRLISHTDDFTDTNRSLYTLSAEKSEVILEEVHNEKDVGFFYHMNEYGYVDMITYSFYFSYCLEIGTTSKVNLRYGFANTSFIQKNIDTMNICVNVKSFEHKDDPSCLLYFNNAEGQLSRYISNSRRDFLPYNGSTQLWHDNDFKYVEIDKEEYKSNYYCFVSVYFTDEKVQKIASNLKEAEIKQEVWLLNS